MEIFNEKLALRLSIFPALTNLGWSQSDLGRSVLPIPEPPAPVITKLESRKATAPPRFDIKEKRGNKV